MSEFEHSITRKQIDALFAGEAMPLRELTIRMEAAAFDARFGHEAMPETSTVCALCDQPHGEHGLSRCPGDEQRLITELLEALKSISELLETRWGAIQAKRLARAAIQKALGQEATFAP